MRWLPILLLMSACASPRPSGQQNGGPSGPGNNSNALQPGVAIDRAGLSPTQETRYQAGLRAYQQHRYPEAIDIYMRLARENPCCGVLGMVVASLASTAPSPERAAAAATEADAAPNDKLKQFVAGVLAHYAAHVNGRDAEEKARLYRQALRYLERVRETYSTEPRVFIYLAVSNFRLGNQRDAEQFIERAVQLGDHDPDAYYCRAEIFQRVNVRRSIADIDTYLRMNEVNEARGAVGDPGKTERVRLMRAHLIAVSEGRAQPEELFDPVLAQRMATEQREPGRAAGNPPRRSDATTPSASFSNTPMEPSNQRRTRLLGVLAVTGVAAGAWAAVRARAKRVSKEGSPRGNA